MSDVLVRLKNGVERAFKERGRAGGSYSVRVLFEGAFVTVEDEWGKRTSFPAESVAEVVESPIRSGW